MDSEISVKNSSSSDAIFMLAPFSYQREAVEFSLTPEKPSPLHAKRIVDSHKTNSLCRVRVSGAEMSDIFRAFRGRLNLCYLRIEDNDRGEF